MLNLFINACVRENSRTYALAVEIMKKHNIKYIEVNLENMNLTPLDSSKLKYREELIQSNKLNDKCFDLAHQFANADNIIIAAPYWDLSFPALLKIYLENICVSNITFKYGNKGPIGLCKAQKLIYVTTAGGKIFADHGYEYIKSLSCSLLGIKNTTCFKMEMLDVYNIQKEDMFQKVDIIEYK